MFEIRSTARFLRWLDKLRDQRGRSLIQARIDRLEMGDSGDARPVGEDVYEMRIHFGPGYRVYFTRREKKLIILLAGGDKDGQIFDIRLAKRLAREL